MALRDRGPWVFVAVFVAAILLLAALQAARLREGPEEAGGAGGRITGLRLVGNLSLAAPNADVWFHDGHAYVGTWAGPCPGAGVKVVDVQDPERPRRVASLARYANTSAEDVVVHRVDATRFSGDLLAVGLQGCTETGRNGLDLWDVSEPARPRHLAFFATPPGGVHELSLAAEREDGRVLALLAVPFAEPSAAGGDFRIVDVTDPRRPVLASEWGITRERGSPPEAGRGAMPATYAHSALSSADGTVAYVSYWDAGVQILDISDPERPRYVGNTSYAENASHEGNAHSVALAPEKDLLVEATEDFDARTPILRVRAPPAVAGEYEVAEADFGPRVNATAAVEGALAYAGRGCRNDTAPPFPRGAVALVDRGVCTFEEKAEVAEARGASALVVVNNEPGPPVAMGSNATGDAIGIPALMVDLANGTRLKAAAANATVLVSASAADARRDAWGGLRLFDASDPARPRLLAEHLTPHAANRPAPDDGGRYSAHNPVWLPRDEALVVSWFSDGVRVLDVSDPTRPREIASWVPPDLPGEPDTGVSERLGGDERKADVWGVAVDGDTVYASDVARGLFVLRLEREG